MKKSVLFSILFVILLMSITYGQITKWTQEDTLIIEKVLIVYQILTSDSSDTIFVLSPIKFNEAVYFSIATLDSFFVDFIDANTEDTLQFLTPVQFTKTAIFDTTFTSYAQKDSTDTLVFLGVFEVGRIDASGDISVFPEKNLLIRSNYTRIYALDSSRTRFSIGDDGSATSEYIMEIRDDFPSLSFIPTDANRYDRGQLVGTMIYHPDPGDTTGASLVGVKGYAAIFNSESRAKESIGVYGISEVLLGSIGKGYGVLGIAIGADTSYGVRGISSGGADDYALYLGDGSDTDKGHAFIEGAIKFEVHAPTAKDSSGGLYLDSTLSMLTWVDGSNNFYTILLSDYSGGSFLDFPDSVKKWMSDTIQTAIRTGSALSDTLAEYITDGFSTNSLLLYLPMDYDANDYSGNSNNGTVSGATHRTQTDSFKVGVGAYSFDASGDSINCGSAVNPQFAITMSAWVFPTNISGNVSHIAIYDSSNDVPIYLGLEFGKLRAMFEGVVGGSNVLIVDDALTLNKWQCVACDYDSITGTANLYINGVKIKTNTTTSFKLKSGSGYNLKFGGSQDGTGFKGLIDEGRIYSRILSPEEHWNYYFNSDIFNLQNAKHIGTEDVNIYFHRDAVYDTIGLASEGKPAHRNKVTVTAGRDIDGDQSWNNVTFETDSSNQQYYCAIIEWVIPSDFHSFNTTDPLDLYYRADDEGDDSNVDLIIYKSGYTDSLDIGTVGVGATSNDTWVVASITSVTSLNDISWSAEAEVVFQYTVEVCTESSLALNRMRIRYNKK